EGVRRDLEVAGRQMRAVVISAPEGRRLLYAMPQRPVQRDLADLGRAFLITVLAAILLTALLSCLVSRRFSKDVAEMVSVTRAVTGGNLAARLPENPHGADEIRMLRRDLNRMIGE